MFDIGWSELLLIGGVALVVIGPKDLPRALRTLGQTTSKMRRMAADFQRQFNEAMREADMEEFRKGVSDVVDTARDLKNNFNPIDRLRTEIRGAIDDSGASKPLPTTDAPAAGDYFTNLPEQPAVAPAGPVIAAEAASAGTAAQGGARAIEAGAETPPARKKRVARPKSLEAAEEGAAEPAARRKSPARAKKSPASAKAGALPADTHPVPPPPGAPAAPKRTRARKAASADATPKKPAPRRKSAAAAGAASVADLAPDVGTPPATAPSAEAITPANKPASDGTS